MDRLRLTRRTGNDVDFYVVDASNPSSNRLLVENKGGGWEVADWSPDDKQILAVEGISINETYLWLIDVATGKTTLLTPKGGKDKVAYSNAAFAKDGKGLYVTLDKDSEFQRLAYTDLKAQKFEFLTPDTADVEDFDVSPDGKTIAYAANEKGVNVLHLFDTIARQERPGPKLPLGTIGNVQWHEDGGIIGFTMETARANSDAYSYDVKTGKVDRWTFSETGGLNAATFSEPELISWKSADGREITGFLYRPPAKFTGKRPVSSRSTADPKARRARISSAQQLSPQRPGHRDHPPQRARIRGVWEDLPQARQRRAARGFRTRTSARSSTGSRRSPTWTPTRCIVAGGSYGGYMALASSVLLTDRIAGAISTSWGSPTSSRSSSARKPIAVTFGAWSTATSAIRTSRKFLESISPLNRANEDQETALRDPGLQRPARSVHRGRADRGRPQEDRARPCGSSWRRTRDTASRRKRTPIFNSTRRSSS